MIDVHIFACSGCGRPITATIRRLRMARRLWMGIAEGMLIHKEECLRGEKSPATDAV